MRSRDMELAMTNEMCRRVELPLSLGRVILGMARTTTPSPVDMELVAKAVKYASDNRERLINRVPMRTTSKPANFTFLK